MIKGVERRKGFSIEYLASFRDPYKNVFHLDGEPTFLTRKRESIFVRDNYACCRCGIRANIAAQERYGKSPRWHINFYALVDGGERLMILDHIIPRARKGSNDDSNLQVLCERCNAEKGSSKPSKEKGDKCLLKPTKKSNYSLSKGKSSRSVVFSNQILGEVVRCNSFLQQRASMIS